MFNPARFHRRQPTRLPRPWDSLGENTGVGCHLLLQCMEVKSEGEAAQSCPTVRDPMDWSPPGSSVHGIFQARVLEWGASAFSDVLYYLTLKINVMVFSWLTERFLRIWDFPLLKKRPYDCVTLYCHFYLQDFVILLNFF